MARCPIHARDARPGGPISDTPPQQGWTGWTVGHRFAFMRFYPSNGALGGLDKMGGWTMDTTSKRLTHANKAVQPRPAGVKA